MSDLTDSIRKIVEQTDLVDPHEIAERVMSSMTPTQYRQALDEALVVYVRTTLSRDRLGRSGPAGNPARSSKVQAVRSAWQRRLQTPLLVNGAYKKFGECSRDDLYAVAAALRADAALYVAKAEYYEEIAEALPAGAVVSALVADPTEVVAA